MKWWKIISIIVCMTLGLWIGYNLGHGIKLLPCSLLNDLPAGTDCESYQNQILQNSIIKGSIYGIIIGFVIGLVIIFITGIIIKKSKSK